MHEILEELQRNQQIYLNMYKKQLTKIEKKQRVTPKQINDIEHTIHSLGESIKLFDQQLWKLYKSKHITKKEYEKSVQFGLFKEIQDEVSERLHHIPLTTPNIGVRVMVQSLMMIGIVVLSLYILK